MNKPNFFILGAAKSGTTALYRILKQHPRIFLTGIKEPTFFSEPFQVVKNPLNYFELYDGASNETILGEASHAYLTNPRTAGVLKALFPEARFLVILRNPAERAHSLYNFNRRLGYEYLNTFEAALAAEERRFNSRRFRKNYPENFYNFLYFRSGLYAEQIRNYYSIFPREQFHILKFDDFVADPAGVIRGIFQFLGVDPDFSPKLDVDRNSGDLTARFTLIQYYAAKIRPHSVRRALAPFFRRVNSMKSPPLLEKTRRDLMEKYAPSLRDLIDLTGISFF